MVDLEQVGVVVSQRLRLQPQEGLGAVTCPILAVRPAALSARLELPDLSAPLQITLPARVEEVAVLLQLPMGGLGAPALLAAAAAVEVPP
jgi:hypothetical protein